MNTYHVGLSGVKDVDDRKKAIDLVFFATQTPTYNRTADEYRVLTELTPEEFRALSWPDGCTFRFS
jgi:hypothetical protein